MKCSQYSIYSWKNIHLLGSLNITYIKITSDWFRFISGMPFGRLLNSFDVIFINSYLVTSNDVFDASDISLMPKLQFSTTVSLSFSMLSSLTSNELHWRICYYITILLLLLLFCTPNNWKLYDKVSNIFEADKKSSIEL